MYKQIFFSLLLLFSFSLVFADLGPSPSYTFSISNASDYPNYTFYYSGNIWPDRLFPITGSTHIYKFNTTIKVFAIDSSLIEPYGESQLNDEDNLVGLIKEAIISNEIQLDGGHTTLEISSFNDSNKSMLVFVKNFVPDAAYPFYVFFDVIVWVFIFASCIFVAWLVLVKNNKEKSK